MARWEAKYGPINSSFEEGGYTFVLLDSLSLDSGSNVDETGALRARTLAHLAHHAEEARRLGRPTILATHIPLHKEGQNCAGDVADVRFTTRGHVYEQTMLLPATTKRLLADLAPTLVFTGHDHEGCVFLHSGMPRPFRARDHAPVDPHVQEKGDMESKGEMESKVGEKGDRESRDGEKGDTKSGGAEEGRTSAQERGAWRERQLTEASHPGMIVEHTVRSVMGDYGGNIAVLDIAQDGAVRVTNFRYLTMHQFIAVVVTNATLAAIFSLAAMLRRCWPRLGFGRKLVPHKLQ